MAASAFPRLLVAIMALASVALVGAEKPVPASHESGGFLAFWNALKNADGSSNAVTVSSQTYNGYKRTKLPDGRYRPETYAFCEGGYRGGTAAGQPADRVPFLRIVQTIAGPLAAQSYVPSSGMENTELMILVFWGVTWLDGMPGYQFSSTAGPTSTGQTGASQLDSASVAAIAFDNHWRDETNFRNARILGYTAELNRTAGIYGLGDLHQDLISDLEDPRYYVVLQAYDFPKARDQKRLVLLWSTRYSIRERRNDFDRDLAAMTQRASRYFGQNSHGLQRNLSFKSSVEIGDLKVISFDPEAVREIGPTEPAKPAEKPETKPDRP